jgi:hypothetical protein
MVWDERVESCCFKEGACARPPSCRSCGRPLPACCCLRSCSTTCCGGCARARCCGALDTCGWQHASTKRKQQWLATASCHHAPRTQANAEQVPKFGGTCSPIWSEALAPEGHHAQTHSPSFDHPRTLSTASLGSTSLLVMSLNAGRDLLVTGTAAVAQDAVSTHCLATPTADRLSSPAAPIKPRGCR